MSSKYWLYAPGENAEFWQNNLRDEVMTIGWGELGDLRLYATREDISEALIRIGVDMMNSEAPKKRAASLYCFVHDVEVGDVILAKEGRKKIVGYGIVTSDYRHNPSYQQGDFYNLRDVEWHPFEKPVDTPYTMPTGTLFQPSQQSLAQLVEAIPQIANAIEPEEDEALYQKRARTVFPILVRQAHARQPITYSDLAQEVGMPNARNLNYVLGYVGDKLSELAKEWHKDIPPLQCLVVNKNTGLPGEGFWAVLGIDDYQVLPALQRQEVFKSALTKLFIFQEWERVLQALGLSPLKSLEELGIAAANLTFRGGESAHHKKLKEYIAEHPETIGLAGNHPKGKNEIGLPSGDSLDVSFEHDQWIGIEVKSKISSEADITRGIYQCVKYKSVMRAFQTSKKEEMNAEAILVLQGSLSERQIELKNMLGVRVIENISPDE